MRLLLTLGALLWVASRIHVTLWLMGSPVATPSLLQIAVVAAYAVAVVAVWTAARSVLHQPFWPRHLSVRWA